MKKQYKKEFWQDKKAWVKGMQQMRYTFFMWPLTLS